MEGPRIEVVRGEPTAMPLALVHGLLGRPAMWRATLEALAWRGDVLLAQLPGHGPAPWYPIEPSFDGAVRELAAALPDGCVAVGHSMGARVVLAISLLPESRVAGAVLVGAHAGLEMLGEREARRRWDEEQARAATVDFDAFIRAWEALPVFATQGELDGPRHERRRAERRQHEPAGIAWALRALGTGVMPPLREALGRTTVPLCFVAGERDEKFVRLAHDLASATPMATCEIVPGAGHDVALEDPRALARIVRARADARGRWPTTSTRAANGR